MHGRLITAEAALEPYRAAWDELAAAAGRPFAAPGWTLPWWRHAAPAEAELRVALALDGEELVGLAPFYLEPGGARVTTYRLLASAVSSRVEPLARTGLEEPAAQAFVAALAGAAEPPDALAFDGVPSGSPWPGLFRAAWPGGRPVLVVERASAAPFVSLAGRTADEWLASRTHHFRKRMRQGTRRVEAEGGRFRLANAATLAGDLAAFVRLHGRRWASRGGSGVVTPAVERMLADVDPTLLRVWCLEAGGSAVAVEVLLSAGGETSFWLGGFDEERASLQPSIQTMLRALEHAFEAGDRAVDLGEGDHGYKRRFADGAETLVWATLVPRTRHFPEALALATARRARHGLAARLPERVKRALRRSAATA